MSENFSGSYDWDGWERRRRLLAVSDNRTYCGVSLTILTATQDHVVPLSKGGSDADDNIVLSCYNCNSLKSDLMPLDFFIGRNP